MPAFSLERLRRLLHSPGNAPLAHSCFGLTPRGEAFDILHRTRAFRPFCLLRLPSLLWFAFGGYPTRPEICHRHISFSGSPHTVGNHPLRGRWPEGPDEVAMKESCPNPAPSSVAYGDSFPPRGSLSETTALPQPPIYRPVRRGLRPPYELTNHFFY